MPECSEKTLRTAAPGPLARLWIRDGSAVLGWSLATLVLGLGTYFGAVALGAEATDALLGALAAGTVWAAIAGPAAAAGAAGSLSALVRGGIVADASGVWLVALWVAGLGQGDGPRLTFAAAAEVYCVYAVICLTAVGAVGLCRGVVGRYAMSVGVSALLMLAVASPFWVNGAAQWAGGQAGQVVGYAVTMNPFYSIDGAVADQTRVVWHLRPVLYRITWIGEYVSPPPLEWYYAVVNWGAVAAFLFAVQAVKRMLLARPPAGV